MKVVTETALEKFSIEILEDTCRKFGFAPVYIENGNLMLLPFDDQTMKMLKDSRSIIKKRISRLKANK